MLDSVVRICNYSAWRPGRRVTVTFEPSLSYLVRPMHSQNKSPLIINENNPPYQAVNI